MQTFVPCTSFGECVRVLDYRRLGKQRVECLQILNAIERGGSWSNHPAVSMWRGFENTLKIYGNACIREWVRRGYVNNMQFWKTEPHWSYPTWWWGEIHSTHRSNLLRKDPNYYRQFHWEEPDDLPYFWPTLDKKSSIS
jgi:hypothetical protein